MIMRATWFHKSHALLRMHRNCLYRTRQSSYLFLRPVRWKSIGATIVKKIATVLFGYTLVVSGGASAASLLTTDTGYTGPILDFGSYGDAPYILTKGPL